MSTSPLVPKLETIVPLFASSAISRLAAVKMIRGPSRAVARPVCDAASRRRAAGQRESPDFLAVLRRQRDDAVRRRQIHHAVDDDWRGLGIRSAGAAPSGGLSRRRRVALQAVAPDLDQLRDVLRIDLRERRRPAASEVVAVHRPVVARFFPVWRLSGDGLPQRQRDEHCAAGRTHQPRRTHDFRAHDTPKTVDLRRARV